MDIQFWVWLIVIVITLIARANKKKPQTFDPEQREFPNTPNNETKPISFEDLLREIQASKAPQPKPVVAAPKQEAPQKQYDFEDYDDNLEDESRSLEKQEYQAEDKIYETYENAKKAAFSRASLEETMKVEDTEVTYNQFKEYSKAEGPKKLAAQYAKELKNPQSFKRALILSEILNKRF